MLGPALLALAVGASAPAPATAHGTRGCGERAEPSAPDAAQVAAPLRFFDEEHPSIPARELRGRDGGPARVKLALDVRAGAVVTLSVARKSRRRLALEYARIDEPRDRHVELSDGQRSVTFTACPADEPMFSGPGVVGARTAFPGAVIVTGRQCARFALRVRGERRRRALRVGIGRRCP